MNDELSSYAELAEVLAALPLLLREARRARRLTMLKAAAQIGISNSTICRIEAGEGFYIDSALAILRWLGAGGGDRG